MEVNFINSKGQNASDCGLLIIVILTSQWANMTTLISRNRLVADWSFRHRYPGIGIGTSLTSLIPSKTSAIYTLQIHCASPFSHHHILPHSRHNVCANSSFSTPYPPTTIHIQKLTLPVPPTSRPACRRPLNSSSLPHTILPSHTLPSPSALRPNPFRNRQSRSISPRCALHEGNARDTAVRLFARRHPDPRPPGRQPR